MAAIESTASTKKHPDANTQDRFKLPVTPSSGYDEMNLAEFSVSYLGFRVPPNIKTLIRKDEIFDKAKQQFVQRELVVTASDAYGLPTSRDDELLLHLIDLAWLQTRFKSREIQFSRYELARMMGWPTSGASYRRIDDALARWHGVSLHWKKSWRSKEDGQWNTKMFHILEEVNIQDSRRTKGQQELRLCSCTLSQEFFNSLKNGNVKPLNMDMFRRLDVPAARQMYRFLDKRFHHTRTYRADLNTFACEKIGFSRNYKPSKLIEKMRPGIRELEESGYITSLPDDKRFVKTGRGQYDIVFHRASRELTNVAQAPAPDDVDARTVYKALVDRGITAATARKLVDDKNTTLAYIRGKIELFDWTRENDPEKVKKSPSGWLFKAISNDWKAPDSFETKAEREAKKVATEERKRKLKQQELECKAQQAKQTAEQKQQVADYLATLSHGQKIALERDAIANAPQFLKERFWRFHNKKPQQEEEMKAIIVHNHVLDLLAKHEEPFALKCS